MKILVCQNYINKFCPKEKILCKYKYIMCQKSNDDAELNQHLMGEDEDDIEKAEKKIEMKEQNYGSSGGFLSNQSRGGN